MADDAPRNWRSTLAFNEEYDWWSGRITVPHLAALTLNERDGAAAAVEDEDDEDDPELDAALAESELMFEKLAATMADPDAAAKLVQQANPGLDLDAPVAGAGGKTTRQLLAEGAAEAARGFDDDDDDDEEEDAEDDADRALGRLGLMIEVDEDGESREVTPAQAAAVAALEASGPDLVAHIGAAVAAYALDVRDVYSEGWSMFGDPDAFERIIPADMKPADARGRYSVHGVTILDIGKDGLAYARLDGGCVWDEEHGIGITLHGTRVVGVGHAAETADAAYAEADE